MKQILATQQEILQLFPTGISIVEVSQLVDVIEKQGTAMELSQIARKFPKQSTPHFLSILRAAQQLGLVKRAGALVCLTDLGLGYGLATEAKKSIIRSELTKIDPFRTTIDLISRRGIATIEEIVVALRNKGAISQTSQTGEFFIRELLIEWAISTELLSFTGKSFI